MNTVVADASLCAAWILPDENTAVAEQLLAAIEEGRVGLRVPALWWYEMTNLLRSAVRRGRLTAESAARAGTALGGVPIRGVDVPTAPAREKILELGLAHDLSAYDATYLELALRLRAPLHTADRRLGEVARTLGLPG